MTYLAATRSPGLPNNPAVHSIKARLHGFPRLINTVESTKVNRVNSSFQRKWSTGLTGEQVGDGQFSYNVVDSLWVTHHRLPVSTSKSRPVPHCRTSCSSLCLVLLIWLLSFVNYFLIMLFKWRDDQTQLVLDLLRNQGCLWNVKDVKCINDVVRKLITRPEESYRLWCVVVCDQETSKTRRPWPALCRSVNKKNTHTRTTRSTLGNRSWLVCWYG